MVIIWISLAIVTVFCLVKSSKHTRFSTKKGWLEATAFITFLILVTLLLPLPIVYTQHISIMEDYKALQETVDTARENKEIDIERAAIMVRIAEMNMDIKRAQYWNQTFFSIYYPDKVMELEFIE